tara:strand:- start:112 stop:996 length:885 start_codon:yes stop_codon:yes gene_type:complete
MLTKLYRFFFIVFLLCQGMILFAKPLKIFISVDMEGIGGIGTSEMTRHGGKDYNVGRQLMTDEVNAVVKAIFKNGPSEILVNDSHGDMQNLIHQQLDPRVVYIQGNKKPFGMVQGLDDSFDAAIFLGYHARAGTPRGFLAHTGSGSVKGLWLNGIEVGEGGLNAFFAGELNVPVILAAGDDVFTTQFGELVNCELVATKTAETAQVARLKHGELVQRELFAATERALKKLKKIKPLKNKNLIQIKLKFSSTIQAEVLQAIPGMDRVDGYTVGYTAKNMQEAYSLIRLMYKYVKP